MIPIDTESDHVDEAIACSDRPAVPLLPKAALISLFSPTQESADRATESKTSDRRNSVKSTSSSKSVNFDRVEILEFRETDDTGIPDRKGFLDLEYFLSNYSV